MVGLFRGESSRWNELTLTYVGAPGVKSIPIATNRTVAFVNSWQRWDVSLEIGDILKMGGGEISFTLKSLNATGLHIFSSKEVISGQRPYLEIRYKVVDGSPPIIEGVAVEPKLPSVEDVVKVSANVTDDSSGVKSVALHYIRVSELAWSSMEMVSTNGRTYTAGIPRQPSGSTLSFYVEAFDKAGNSNSSKILSFNVSRPGYYTKVEDQLNRTKSFYEKLIQSQNKTLFGIMENRTKMLENRTKLLESDLANRTRLFDVTLANRTLAFDLALNQTRADYERRISLLLNDYKELLADYEALLVNYTRAGRDSENIRTRFSSVQALYGEVRNQSRYVEAAYQGQNEEIESLRSSLDFLRKSYEELKKEYDIAASKLTTQGRDVENYTFASIAAGSGIIAVASFSVIYHKKTLSRTITRAFSGNTAKGPE
jgi:archaellum component FlaC